MALEVGWDPRFSMLLKLIRTSADSVPDRCQLAGYQGGILHATYSHAHIEPFSDQIGVSIEKFHLK